MPSYEKLTQEQLLLGVVALLAADRDDRIATAGPSSSAIRKTEVVLADAGLAALDIAKILNKKANSVTKTITRARAKGTND